MSRLTLHIQIRGLMVWLAEGKQYKKTAFSTLWLEYKIKAIGPARWLKGLEHSDLNVGVLGLTPSSPSTSWPPWTWQCDPLTPSQEYLQPVSLRMTQNKQNDRTLTSCYSSCTYSPDLLYFFFSNGDSPHSQWCSAWRCVYAVVVTRASYNNSGVSEHVLF